MRAQPATSDADPVDSVVDFSLSNDGKLLGFATHRGTGLYDWRAEKIARIWAPVGPPRITGLPVFSTDGSDVLLVLYRSDPPDLAFGIFDIATRQFKKSVRPDCRHPHSPVYQPGDRAVLFIAGTLHQYLCLYDLETNRSQIILPEGQGFSSLRSVSFLGPDEILFVAHGARDPDTVAMVKSLGGDPVTTDVPYRLKFGGRPVPAFPQILERSKALHGPMTLIGPTELLASRNGERVVYIGRSFSEDARVEEARKHPQRLGSPHRYDVLAIEGGVTREVSHLETYMSFAALSYDGSTAAVGLLASEITKENYLVRSLRNFEPVIVGVTTGAVTKTNLIARINTDPQFAPPASK